MVCEYCQGEFQPKNKKGKYCSTKCRVYAGRGKERIVTIVTPEIVTPVTIPVTISKEQADLEKSLEYYLEEYEKVYHNKKCPGYMSLMDWARARDGKLAELKKIIDTFRV